jgi:hypothetical protein
MFIDGKAAFFVPPPQGGILPIAEPRPTRVDSFFGGLTIGASF